MSKRKLDCPKFSTPEEFERLSPEDQERADRYYSRKIPRSEMRPLTPAEREQFDRAVGRKRKPGAGRPKIGRGARVVAVTMEKGFLENVDAYAHQHGLKRSEMIVEALRLRMGAK